MDYLDRMTTLTATGIVAPPVEGASWKLDQLRHGDKLTDHGTIWPATITAAYHQASTWRMQQESRNDYDYTNRVDKGCSKSTDKGYKGTDTGCEGVGTYGATLGK